MRIGGEEFAVALPGTGLQEARQFADRVRHAIAHQHLMHDAPPALVAATVSVGVTVARPDDSFDTILNRADEALYAAKRGGRNIVVAND